MAVLVTLISEHPVDVRIAITYFVIQSDLISVLFLFFWKLHRLYEHQLISIAILITEQIINFSQGMELPSEGLNFF